MYGFDAAAGGAEALSSRTGVTEFTLSAVQDCSRQSPLCEPLLFLVVQCPGQTHFGVFGR